MDSILVSAAVVVGAVLAWALIVMPAVRWWRFQQYRKGRRSSPR